MTSESNDSLNAAERSAFPGPGRRGAIVLVHGAWAGEFSWLPILPLLRRSGREVYPVSLRGHGARSSESSPTVTLDDHADDVVGVVESLDLESITLVGHSYGGRVITRAWTRLGDRVAKIIYLDAHAPLLGPGAGPPRFEPNPDGMVEFAPKYTPDPAEFGGDQAVAWFMARIMPQSAATLNEEFYVELPAALDKTYVFAAGDPDTRFAVYAAAAKDNPEWRYREVSGSHWLMVADPETTAAIILAPDGGPA